MTSGEAPSGAVEEGRGSDGAGLDVFRGVRGVRSPLHRGMGTARDKFVGSRRRPVSFPPGLIRNDGVNREVNAHQASEVWTKDIGFGAGSPICLLNCVSEPLESNWRLETVQIIHFSENCEHVGRTQRGECQRVHQMPYINEEAAVKKTRILKCIAAAQRADPADLGQYGSAKDV
ncbi:hypothetical protein C8J57DRAFT_1248896 [Mycena rebaudengoi]|nr:hypothetical protein C8J57DRAFT_1248896 [Mycena rebaudengoi]